jgi:hypothetical protein
MERHPPQEILSVTMYGGNPFCFVYKYIKKTLATSQYSRKKSHILCAEIQGSKRKSPSWSRASKFDQRRQQTNISRRPISWSRATNSDRGLSFAVLKCFHIPLGNRAMETNNISRCPISRSRISKNRPRSWLRR